MGLGSGIGETKCWNSPSRRLPGPQDLRRQTSDLRRSRGFTLLEVMIALMILAMGLTAISFANSVAISQVARVTRITKASFLMEGVVNDVHAYYQRKGFPTNTLDDRECELPREFTGEFKCRYDLKAMNMTPDVVQGMVQAGLNAAMGGGAGIPGAAGTGTGTGAGSSSGTTGTNGTNGTGSTSLTGSGAAGVAGIAAGMSKGSGASSGGAAAPVQFDPMKLAQLAWLLSPEGEMARSICKIDPTWITMGVMGITTYMPMIMDQISKRTRQLTVRMSWKDGPTKTRELKVQTFIVSLPEEEVAQMRERDRQQQESDAIRSNSPQTDTTKKTTK